MRVRIPALLVPRRRRTAAPVEHIDGWREVGPPTLTVSTRPHVTVGAPLGETVRPLATRSLPVPVRLTAVLSRPVDGRVADQHLPDLATTRPPRPVPAMPRLDRLPPLEPLAEPESDESWSDDDSIAELRAILNTARQQAAGFDAPVAAESGPPEIRSEPSDSADQGVVSWSWPEPGAPAVRLPWENDDRGFPADPPGPASPLSPPPVSRPVPPARPVGSAAPGPSRPVAAPVAPAAQAASNSPAPARARRLSLAESRRRGITVRPPRADRPAVNSPDDQQPAPPEPPITEPTVAGQRIKEPSVSTVQRRAHQDGPVDEPPAIAIDEPAGEQPTAWPVDRPTVNSAETAGHRADVTVPDVPDPAPAGQPPVLPAEVVRVSATGRQIVAPRGPAVGRLPGTGPTLHRPTAAGPAPQPPRAGPTPPSTEPDHAPADTARPAPIRPTRVEPRGDQPARSRAERPRPNGETGGQPPHGPRIEQSRSDDRPPAEPRTARRPDDQSPAEPRTERPRPEHRPPADPRPERHRLDDQSPAEPHTGRPQPGDQSPAESRAERPRLGLGEPLHRPQQRPSQPFAPPDLDLELASPEPPTVEWGYRLGTDESTVERTAEPEPWTVDDLVALPPLARQVVSPNGRSRPVGLGAPLTERPAGGRKPDLSDVIVHRGPAVNEQARAMRARAFTRDGEVYLPDDHGRRDEQATLAHELIHVVQQRTYGDALPPEWSPAGQALEHAAAAVGEQPPPQPNPYQVPQPPDPVHVPMGVQREPDNTTITFPMPVEALPAPREAERPRDELAGYRDQLIALCDLRTVDMNDSRSINELATRLYQPLRRLLRGELLVDRERAGLLTDFR